MRSLRRGLMLVGLLLAAMVGGGWPPTAAAQVTTTTVADTVYLANGTPASGTVLVSWPSFTTASGASVPSGSTAVTLGSGGALSVALAANAGATPLGTYYTVVYHLSDGSVSHEYWVVPTSGSAVTLAAVRNTVLPTSVAMQTVSKQYVDTAIAAAVSGHPLDSTPYVLKAGDTMTGPLVLPGDPTASLQAADKQYVDTNTASVAAGLNQKVSLTPAGTQVVTQPSGTQLQVNLLNGKQYASQYLVSPGNNGIANAAASADCASGCTIVADQTYPGNEAPVTVQLPNHTHVSDLRGGGDKESFLNPLNKENNNPATGGANSGEVVDVATTTSPAGTPVGLGTSVGLFVTQEGYAGGNNLYPFNIDTTVPYFKSTYSAMQMVGTYYTQGQHVLEGRSTRCYAVGDCMIGSQFIYDDGGFRDAADEGTHPYDLLTSEDTQVVQGTCATGCTTGSTAVKLTLTSGAGTQGEGRFLLDLNPANVISSGTLTGGSDASPHPVVNFSGTTFPVSVFFQTGQKATSQSNNIAPGTVTLPIATTGVPAGYSTNTAAAPGGSGVACVVDNVGIGGSNPSNYEMANYSVVDSTHLQLTLNKAHASGATIAMGGLCGYGLEQKVDTQSGIRQVFPVVGSSSATSLYYAPGQTTIVGISGLTSAFVNLNLTITSVARSGGVVTLTTSGNFPVDVNGLTMTVGGVTDSSYNGSFAVTTTGANTLTYAQSGANSTSSGGTLSMVTGAYGLYPMAEVLGVFDQATRTVDGLMTLAPNAVAWTAGDAVEEPHFFQMEVRPDTEDIFQTEPRPKFRTAGGMDYEMNVGPGLAGWRISNSAPATGYFGSGGTHTPPDEAYQSLGLWKTVLDAQAGESNVFDLHCNSHGCNKWNSGYNLFLLDSSAGTGTDAVNYAPQTSTMTFALRGASYTFAPTGFTAGTINATTVNATNVSGGAAISGGTVNNAVIGGTTPAAGTFGGSSGTPLTVTSGNTTSTVLALKNTSGSGEQYNIEIAGSAAPSFANNGLVYHEVNTSTYPFWYSGGPNAGIWAVANGLFGWSSNSTDPRGSGSAGLDTAVYRAGAGVICASAHPLTPSCDGSFKAGQFVASGSAPTIANGAGAGTSPGTPAVTGSNMAGVITVTTGTSTTTGATLATVTFNGTLGTAPQGCMVMPRNANAAAAAGTIYTTAPSTTSWAIGVGGTALPASATYQWSYQCM